MSQHVPTDTTGNAETPPNPIICNKIPKTLRDTTRNAHRQHSKHVDVVAVAVVVVVVIIVIVAVVVVTLLPLRAPPCAAGVGGYDICQYMLICDAYWTIEYYRDQGSLTVAENCGGQGGPEFLAEVTLVLLWYRWYWNTTGSFFWIVIV